MTPFPVFYYPTLQSPTR